ncbi:hypothetical protein SAY86_010292 [Trapa natans]|uniref:Uncharacterized protein n=1 Tax=Trapa natans TaxID=22666 RepID=A0AAN7L6D8_TRANT|nr:hypothetical protein SAY86_010292 [Trapa natans]
MSTTPFHSVLIVQSSLYQNLNCINGDFIDSSAMPGLAIMENSCTSLEVPVGEVNFLPFPKERFNHQMSPRSPLSPDTPRSVSIDLAVHGAMVNISIEQLYNNVCEMQSSEHSPSAPSFLSYGEESRIDSELCHIIGCFGDAEMITKNAIVTENEEGSNNSTVSNISADDFPKKKDIQFIKEKTPKASNSIPKSKKRPTNLKPPRKQKTMISPVASTKLQKASEASGGSALEDRDLAPFLLKLTRDMVATGENPRKALGLALRAVNCYDKITGGEGEPPSLELVMRLHFVAAIYCNLGRYAEAVPVLERSVDIPVLEKGETHALAKFSGCMQLGDTYAMLGQIESSIMFYTAGLEIQRQFLGEADPRVAETCRYVAEAHVQALQFNEARKVCQMALDVHCEGGGNSLEEAADRRLMGLMCDSMGDYESALEHLNLASVETAASNPQEVDMAVVDRSIGDAYLSLSLYDEAICAHHKALAAFKAVKGEKHPAAASVLVRLAELYNKIGKFKESKSHCGSALKIYDRLKPGIQSEEVAIGLVEISVIYQSMDEFEPALKLLKRALRIYGNAPGQRSLVAGLEAQVGVMYYMTGNFSHSYAALNAAVSKFRASSEKKSALLGITLNQLGLACVQRYAINEAADLFEEAREILEIEYCPYHPDTLGVYSNLAGTYDAMGRVDDALDILEYVVGMREERLGTANPHVDDEKRRLEELLKETGRVRSRNSGDMNINGEIIAVEHRGVDEVFIM